MARSKKSVASIAAAAARSATAAALEGAEEGTELDVLPNEDPEEMDALEQLREIGEGSADCKFVLTCLAPLDRRGKIDELDKEDLPDLWQYVRDTFGPGKYSVHAVVNGTYVKGSRQKIQISTLAKQRGGAAPGAPTTAPAGTSTDTQQWLREQEAKEERRRLEAREDRKFMLQLLVGALPALQGLLRPPSLADQAAAISAIQGLNGSSGSTEKVLDTLLKGLELGKDLGGGGSADSWPGLIREVVKDLSPGAGNLLTQIAERRAAAAPNGQAPRAPAAAAPRIPYQPTSAPAMPAAGGESGPPSAGAPAPNHPEVTDPMLAAQLPLLQKLAGELLEFAANGADPGLCAEALVAKIPRTVRAFVKPEHLQGWLTHPEWWTVLETFKPELKPYQGYCDDVRQTLLKLMSEPESEPENP